MSRDILNDIINEFEPEKFIRFFRAKNSSFSPRQESLTQYNDDNFKGGHKIGDIKFQDNSLIICTFQVLQPLSEKSGKRLQYEKGKKILKETQSDAGIFIFYDQSGNFRFSLIYANYLGRRRDWSTFRRFTYFVSKEFLNKTFLQRIGDGDFSNLEKIKDAFSVEKVTKEFYLEYRKLFEDLVKDLDKNHTFKNEAQRNNINTENFAKKLLGQIVFIYFLQKKGWLGVPAGEKWGKGDQNFLSSLFKEAVDQKKNYYNDYLEKLFYDTLNNSERGTADPSFSKIFNCRIPFLNGGLFEPEYDWQKSFIYLDNSIFGRILETFDRYNFTVEEESPEDKEVAIDPEMLGKVFENLLEENLRKGKGTYYTPREIVHYMCQESLVNFLIAETKVEEKTVRKLIRHYEIEPLGIEDIELYESNKELALNKASEKSVTFWKADASKLISALTNIKIVDPACGSGAFLVGMLHEIIRLKQLLGSKGTEYELKKETIQNCIYGVDIDPGAIEIAKLRLWLSLVVDYGIEDIEPLPNLDYKIMVGNSLIEKLDSNLLAKTSDHERSELIDNFRELKDTYFNLSDSQEKKKLRVQINELILLIENYDKQKERRKIWDSILAKNNQVKLFDLGERQQTLADVPSQIKQLSELEDLKEIDHFEWHLNFNEVFEKGGFDIVIANPPYVRQEEITQYKSTLKDIYSVYSPRSDLYTYFYEKGIELLRKDGCLTFISSNKFMRAKYGEKLREFLKHNIKLLEIIDFGNIHKFDAITNTLIIVLKKQQVINSQFLYSEDINSDKINCDQDELQKDSWTLANEAILSLKKKIEEQGVPLSEWAIKISYGIKAGYNDAFVLDENLKNTLTLKNPNVTEIIRPLLRGRDIGRYTKSFAKKYVIISKYRGHEDLSRRYPEIVKHLERYKSKLQARGQVKNGQHHWLELDNNPNDSYLRLFDLEKIIWIELSDKNKFTYTNKGEYILAGAFMITGESLKYLLAFLNSTLCLFYFNLICNSSGMDTTQWKKFVLDKMPVKRISAEEQKPFVEIVEKILVITDSDDYPISSEKQAKVKDYEKQIDQLVYKLYNLTPEEKAIVEGNIKS